MSDPVRFLSTLSQTLSTMMLYRDGHPARARAADVSFRALGDLQQSDPRPKFTFLGDEILYGSHILRELRRWDWGGKLADVGIQRVEFAGPVDREEYDEFLADVIARLGGVAADTAEARPDRHRHIRFGGIELAEERVRPDEAALPTATIAYALGEEAETVRWVHREVQAGGEVPIAEAEAVVRSLAVAMHGDEALVLPLVQLKEYDQYTTTHALNVAVLTMGLAEHIGLSASEVRGYGVAGLLHDLGKVRIPKEILNKPGKLTDEERDVMRRHPADGAQIILESGRNLDLAATVAYEHHIMLNGGGYPSLHFRRCCHQASELVHVCDVYDALRTNRPYRDAWESDRVLAYIEEKAGTEFNPDVARPFVEMMRTLDATVGVLPEERESGTRESGNS